MQRNARMVSRPAVALTTVGVAAIAAAALLATGTSGPSATDYTVHEWGLTRYGAASETATSGFAMRSAPSSPVERDDSVEKPLIYFHPGPSFEPTTTISLSIEIAGGHIREVWPGRYLPGGTQGATEEMPAPPRSFEWSDIRLFPGQPCGGDLAPPLTSPACTSLMDGGVCEASELRQYLTPVPTCVSAGGTLTPVLLYNGYIPPTAPLAFGRGTVTNVTAYPIGPVWVPTPDGIRRIDMIAPGLSASVAVDAPVFDAATTGVIDDIQSALVSAGLTELEASHFIAAWRTSLLAAPYNWQAFGLLSEDAANVAYPLTITPAPADVVRVLAFIVEE